MLLWTGQTVSALGNRMAVFCFPLLVLAMTGSPGTAGLVAAAATAPYVLLYLPAGALVDRWDRRLLMIASETVRAVAFLSLPVAAWLDALTVAHVAVVAFVEGAGFVFFSLAETTAIPNIVPKEQLGAAVARNEARTRGAALAGGPLGGVLFGLDRLLPFLANGLTFLVSIVTLLRIREPFQPAREGPPRQIHREIVEGLSWLWRQRFIRAGTVIVSGSNMLSQGVLLLVIVLAQQRGAGAGEIGLIMGMVGGSGLLGSLAAEWLHRRLPAKLVISGTVWVWVICILLFLLPLPPLALGLVYAATSFLLPTGNVVWNTYEMILTPNRLFGRVRSAIMMVAWGSMPLGALLGGWLLQQFDTSITALVLAAGMGVFAVMATAAPSIRRVPDLETAAAEVDRR
jgi:MFS family permease